MLTRSAKYPETKARASFLNRVMKISKTSRENSLNAPEG